MITIKKIKEYAGSREEQLIMEIILASLQT